MTTQNVAAAEQPIAQIMLLGTFHFKDRGLDAYKPQDADILSPQRQQEVAEVLDCLVQFQPTKIAIERHLEQQVEIDQEYQAYRRREFQLLGDEIYQLGFRLAERLGHSQVYCVNAWGRHCSPPLDMDEYAVGRSATELNRFLSEELKFDPWRIVQEFAEAHGQAGLLDEWLARIQQTGAEGDQAKLHQTLRLTLLNMNAEAVILRSHGSYFAGPFEIGVGNQYPGVDYVTAWYSRNLRIFANLQRITEPVAGERILLIMGGGHMAILRHCVEASPKYELVEVAEYLA